MSEPVMRTTHGREIVCKPGEVVFLHQGENVIPNPKPDELTQLRTQLADARRITSELEAAQGIAVHELGRQRELAAARKATIKHLNKLLKAAGVRV